MIWKQFNPYSIEARYSLDYACMLVHHQNPKTILLATEDLQVAIAILHRLVWFTGEVYVASPSLIDELQSITSVTLLSGEPHEMPDVAIVPFSRLRYDNPPYARVVVTISFNSLSYKSLLFPFRIDDNVVKLLNWIRTTHQLRHGVGLYAPRFLIHWTLSVLASHRQSGIHFAQGQLAIDHIYSSSFFWWTGFILVTQADVRES